ncbi:MAG TPA: translation elongation factor Ts [Planctomycetes bacterium]|nr:translation elongation factor Ts [Planctomycetota bacterium]HIN81125.1 translation elongation factor Ts [Planctomycetota bacterium]
MSEISAKTVAELRKKTGAGMMACKKALGDTDGDVEKATDLLRKMGVKLAASKSDRITSQGWIGSYIHSNGRLGAIVEVNCETDFVARNEKFQEFIKNVSMHVAAMSPQVITPEELDAATVERELEIYREQTKDKPGEIQDKIVDGKINKYYSEVCLLQQPYVKDDKKSVQDYLTETIAAIGENIQIRRFSRLEIGTD